MNPTRQFVNARDANPPHAGIIVRADIRETPSLHTSRQIGRRLHMTQAAFPHERFTLLRDGEQIASVLPASEGRRHMRVGASPAIAPSTATLVSIARAVAPAPVAPRAVDTPITYPQRYQGCVLW